MRGLTIARPVRVELVISIGKEVIVDSTDSDEGLTAEMLSETSAIKYADPREALDALRARVRDAGIKAVSRESGLSRRHVQEFVNPGTSGAARRSGFSGEVLSQVRPYPERFFHCLG